MPFQIPALDTFLLQTKNFKDKYIVDRAEKDKFRLLGGVRGATINEDRLADAAFLQNLSVAIAEYHEKYLNINPAFEPKTRYGTKYPEFESKSKEEKAELHKQLLKERNDIQTTKTNPFLRKVLAGACIFCLYNVDKTYGDKEKVKNSSTAKLIFGFLNITKLQDIPERDAFECLNALHDFIESMEALKLPLQWHKNFSLDDNNVALKNDIFAKEKVFASGIVQEKAVVLS